MAKTPIEKDRIRVSVRESRRRKREGTDHCEVCLWTGPAWLGSLLHTHHVVPVRYGGDVEAPDNLITLCPNHHEIADALSHPHQNPPKTKEDLVALLHSIDDELRKTKETPM